MTENWLSAVDPGADEAGEFIREMESQIGFQLHDVVRRHFYSRATDPGHAFPRLETHSDDQRVARYLFGQFHLPTSAIDSHAEFLEFTFVATFDRIWSVVRVPNRTMLTDRFLSRLERARAALDSGASIGDVLGRIMTVVVSELEAFLDDTGEAIKAIDSSIDQIDGVKNLSRALKESLPAIQMRLVDTRTEIASIGSVVDQMESIVAAVVRDDVDLHGFDDTGARIEVFGPSTEIHLLDTSFRALRLKVLQDEQLEQLRHLSERMAVLREHDELTSGRFMGAIASIMLVPTFLVGLYGMNFDKMPELHWHMGYSSVLIIIGIVTVFQIWLFRRKRWI